MITLVLGGARSGKSEAAEKMAEAAADGGPVTYLATAVAGIDDDLDARIARHRARRPAGWTTVDVAGSALPLALGEAVGPVLLDGLGQWLAAWAGEAVDPSPLCAALQGRDGATVVVSDEVGLGVHPVNAVGRRFCDALGELNQAVAAVADRVVLVVAGRLLTLEPT